MGDKRKLGNLITLVTCSVCLFLTLVTCVFLLTQYLRWQEELIRLRTQMATVLPRCSTKIKNGDEATEEETNENLLVSSSARVNMTHETMKHQPHVRMRRDVVSSKPSGTKRRGQKPRIKRRTHQLTAMQFAFDKEEYSKLSINSTVTNLRWWKPVEWCQNRTSIYFNYDKDNYEVTILRDGLYYVYSQITYSNSAALNAYEVKVDNSTSLFSCTQERRFPSGSVSSVVESCHAGAIAFLRAHQTLSIWNRNSANVYRPMEVSSRASFWGVMQLRNS